MFAFSLEDSITIIPNYLNYTLVKNYGAAFGIASGANKILAVISVVICLILIIYIFLSKKRENDVSIFLYLILAGGIGNLIDRLTRGFVVDFIDTPFIATFNIADSLVVIGAFGFFIEEVLKSVFKKNT